MLALQGRRFLTTYPALCPWCFFGFGSQRPVALRIFTSGVLGFLPTP